MRCVVASNKYLINCMVLVQSDFEINEVLNSIIIVYVRCGGGERGLPLNRDVWCTIFQSVNVLVLNVLNY